MKKRILFLNHNFEGEGTYLRCFYLGRQLSRMGYEIDIVCGRRAKGGLSARMCQVEKGLRVITLPRGGDGAPYAGYALRSLMSVPYALSRRYDMVHAFAVAIPSTAVPAIAARLLGKTVMIDWDDAWEGGLATFAHPAAAGVAGFLERRTPGLSGAAGITVVSDFLARRAARLYPRLPVHKIMNGSDTATIHPVDKRDARRELGIPLDEPVLLSMGRTYTGSLELMLEAFVKVLDKRPRAKLYMVGEICTYGYLNDYVRRTRAKYAERINGNIVYAGHVPYDRLKYHLSAADALVLPMEDCAHETSRFPIRFGDYLASGNIIVSNAVGEIKSLMDTYRAGITAHPASTDEFAEQMMAGLDLSSTETGYKTRARELAAGDLSWETVSARLDAVYRHVLDGAPLPAPAGPVTMPAEAAY